MEKLCEFCRVLRALVYCEADAAQLCLCCDAKVHSANALSKRHRRSLLCESCRFRPASFHCSGSDHNIYSCCSCDKAIHTTTTTTTTLVVVPQHQRHPIHTYTGCPSVKEFAALWDLDFDQLITPTHSSSSQPPTRFLIQQIMDLKKLQLKHSNLDTSSIHRLHDTFHPNLVKKHPLLDQDDVKGELFPAAPFTLESLQSSSVVVQGDSFWQCRVQTNHNQFSAQNMQDLGVCEDLSRHDFNIPDVDVTFQNYEQLFGGDYNNNNNNNNDMSSPSSLDRSSQLSPDIIRGLEVEEEEGDNNNMSSATSDHFDPSSSSRQFVDNIIAGSCLFPSYSISQDQHFHDKVDLRQASSKEDATKRYKDKKKKAHLNEKKMQHALASASASASASPSVENADVRKRVIEGEVRMQRF